MADRIRDLVRQLYQAHEKLKGQKGLSEQYLADKANAEQQNLLLRQDREEAWEETRAYKEELNKLYNELNALRGGQANLSDDHIVDRMRRLNQNLEKWVKSHYQDVNVTELASLLESDSGGPPLSASQRRAGIQSYLAHLINVYIFSPCHVGLADDPYGHFLSDLEGVVRQKCSGAELRSWKVANSVAIVAKTGDLREGLFTDIVNFVEGQFGIPPSDNGAARKRQLRDLLGRCADLKITLGQQKQCHVFCCSQIGAEYDPQAMTVMGGGEGQAGEKVRWSLWPAIVKLKREGGDVLEPELVWTTPIITLNKPEESA
ncbi:hypothetical protein BO70DRAFT_356180 [Aspergillus heteromorphus CBS 117.55]|uniref:Uncharacterized protein n=1 Tax=Aspergillus heteromorphus CBS 117.55 TaxID=1448321 RepID=A0A317V2G5_9EURO|nr:uncharacterized protein BO70DRAFT_356180 [Aspergillus heteromorphus CBS 117.55]PWY68473.1 hypothetical protein BO70DRAFT_356180 [Aspergillus heteromorphus CBS 117.55]